MALADIDTIVVVILENRSFDHVLGYLGREGTGVEGLSADAAWLAAHANPHGGATWASHGIGPEIQAIDDPKHDHLAIGVQISTPPADAALGAMGGFVESYLRFAATPPSDPSAVMGWYDQAAVPIHDFLARNFAVCDHWFSCLPTGTQANRLMAMAGETPIVDNAALLLPDGPLVYDWLSAHGVDWCAYHWGSYFPFFSLMPRMLPEIVTSLTLSALGGHGHFRRYANFRSEWTSADPAPSVIFIEPEYSDGPHSDPNDDHPPTGIAKGQAFLADIYATLIANPAKWARTMMIVTSDEHGGFYDHVPPLPIAVTVAGHGFATTGVRVPALVVSPQVAPGSVFKGDLDHTSILQLFDDRFTGDREGYSAAVNARQGLLQRLAAILTPPPATVRAPAIPADVLARVQAAAAGAPPPPQVGASPADPPNAQAFHRVAMKAATEHADLLTDPSWDAVTRYARAHTGG